MTSPNEDTQDTQDEQDPAQLTGPIQQRSATAVMPTVPVGTPGRDSRATLPTPLPPGAQQPWRRGGPGNRTLVVVITVIALVLLAGAGITALTLGAMSGTTTAKGVVVLEPSQYRTTGASCTGSGDLDGVKKGATIRFRGSGSQFTATLRDGKLRNGLCGLVFTASTDDIDENVVYQVSIGDVVGTPVGGDELKNTSGVTIQVASR